MTPASKSVYYFGFYLALLAIILLAVPNTILELFQLQPTTEVWIRVLGVIVLNMGILYIFMAANNHVLFMTLSVYLRASVLLWFILFVALEMAPVRLIIFGLVDAAGAAWTYFALRKNQA
jgi:hypothetical protein